MGLVDGEVLDNPSNILLLEETTEHLQSSTVSRLLEEICQSGDPAPNAQLLLPEG